MFLTLIAVVLAVIMTALLAGKAVRTALKILRKGSGPDNAGQGKKEPEDRKPSRREEAEKKAEEVKDERPEMSEEQSNRFAAVRQAGITESFWEGPVDLDLGGKTFADLCVRNSSLTYLEVNNRSLAGSEFNGFNILLKDSEKMTLIYAGQAVATLARESRTEIRTVEDREVKEIQTLYRTNTFPPRYSSGVLPDDIEKMLGAISAVRQCEGDPSRVAGAMISQFIEPDNVQRLKYDIDPKIQAKESKTETQNVRNSRRRSVT